MYICMYMYMYIALKTAHFGTCQAMIVVAICSSCANTITHTLPTSQVKRNQVRKGMVMVDPRVNPTACWEFKGDILVLHHPTTISPKYQAMGERASELHVHHQYYPHCRLHSVEHWKYYNY